MRGKMKRRRRRRKRRRFKLEVTRKIEEGGI